MDNDYNVNDNGYFAHLINEVLSLKVRSSYYYSVKASTELMSDLGTDVKMSFLILYLSRNRCFLGQLVNGVGTLGRVKVAVYLRVPTTQSFWTGSSSSGPAQPA